MSKLRYVGLDVHKDSIVMAVADSGSCPAQIVARLDWCESRVLAELRKLGPLGSLKVCYEAGPTGYGLHRFLTSHKVDCVVIAPALVPQLQGCHIKTDRRDACKLAHFLRSGDLTSIWVPDEQTEALRDLVRARDDARLAERRIRQQLLKFLLRQGRRCPADINHWTKAHWTWIRQQRFTPEAQQRVLADAIQTAEAAAARIKRLDEDLAQCVAGWKQAPLVKNLQAFRGIQLVTAVGLAAEIGDFERFPRASKFMAFVGLVPRESSSGQTRRQGGLTKAGNRHVRRLLIEAAWQYIGAPTTLSQKLVDRRREVPETVVTIADRALRRLRHKAHKLSLRKKSSTKIAAALARELAGFVWAAARATAGVKPPSTTTPNTLEKVTPKAASAKRAVPPHRATSPKRLAAAGATRLK
jgi:transposase